MKATRQIRDRRQRPIRDRRNPSLPLWLITLPNQRRVTLGEYVKSWRALKALPAHASVKGFDYCEKSAASILREISYGVNDRVNIRGGCVPPVLSAARESANLRRVREKLAATVKCECRWCGSPLDVYKPKEQRFCEGTGRNSCRASYFGF